MKKQIIKKGKHFANFWQRFWLPEIVREKQSVHIRISGKGLRYLHGDADQLDWNKLPGGKYFDLFNPHGQTVMIGWRYNEELDCIEITPYYHNINNTDGYQPVGSVPGYYRPDNVVNISIVDGVASIEVYYSVKGNTVEIDFGDLRKVGRKSDSVQFEKIGKVYSRSNAYFGGNRRAPDKIKFELIFM